jgi:hypothetical protein
MKGEARLIKTGSVQSWIGNRHFGFSLEVTAPEGTPFVMEIAAHRAGFTDHHGFVPHAISPDPALFVIDCADGLGLRDGELRKSCQTNFCLTS